MSYFKKNCQHIMSSVNSKKLTVAKGGFTIIELLTAIGILSVLGTVIISILFATLRAGKKADVLVTLKQDGNNVMSQLTRNIRYAKSLDTPSSCPVSPGPPFSTITITSSTDNAQTTYSCDVGPPTTISSNSASLLDTNTVAVSNCSFSCSQVTLNDPPIININFTLSVKSSTNLAETTGALPFQTSVIMRNVVR